MVANKLDYDVNCPHCRNHIVNHSFGNNVDTYRYNRDYVVEHRCEHCKRKFLISLEDSKTFSHYNRKELSIVLF